MVRSLIAIGSAGVIALGVLATPAAAQPRAGAKCAKSVKVGKVITQGTVTLRCTRTKKGKVWRRVAAASPKPTPTPTPTPTPAAGGGGAGGGGAGGGAGIVPSRTWECAIGTYPYTSYQKLVTAGSSYTVSFTDGTGASSGSIQAGTHAPLNRGTPIRFVGGAWNGFDGEFAPAGTKTSPSLPPITVDNVYTDGGLDNNYYPVVCTPK